MIRFLFRFIGLICLAAAFILLIYDGTKSIAGNRFFLTSLRTLWELINAGRLQKLKPLIEPYAGGFLWDPVMVGILAEPSWSLQGGFGILVLMMGRRKKPLICYQRLFRARILSGSLTQRVSVFATRDNIRYFERARPSLYWAID